MSQAEGDGSVRYTCEEQIATITLNRPNKLNAFDDDQVRLLGDTLRRFDGDEDAQVAVITGVGRAFSSGADVHQRQLRKLSSSISAKTSMKRPRRFPRSGRHERLRGAEAVLSGDLGNHLRVNRRGGAERGRLL